MYQAIVLFLVLLKLEKNYYFLKSSMYQLLNYIFIRFSQIIYEYEYALL